MLRAEGGARGTNELRSSIVMSRRSAVRRRSPSHQVIITLVRFVLNSRKDKYWCVGQTDNDAPASAPPLAGRVTGERREVGGVLV